MLTILLDEAKLEYQAAMDTAYEKFNEYMLAPHDNEENEKSREKAMDDAFSKWHRLEGVIEGLKRAQKFLDSQARCSA